MNNILDKLESLLKNYHADYSIYQDDLSLKSAADGAKQYGITLNETTPTLVLKTKEKFYVAIICGNTRISFKKLKQYLGIKDISLADPETVYQLTGAKIGEVSMINPELVTLIDQNVLNNKDCFGGCGVSKATLRIATDDLVTITRAMIFDFTEARGI